MLACETKECGFDFKLSDMQRILISDIVMDSDIDIGILLLSECWIKIFSPTYFFPISE